MPSPPSGDPSCRPAMLRPIRPRLVFFSVMSRSRVGWGEVSEALIQKKPTRPRKLRASTKKTDRVERIPTAVVPVIAAAEGAEPTTPALVAGWSSIRKNIVRRRKSSTGDVKRIELSLPNIIQNEKKILFSTKLLKTKQALTAPKVGIRVLSMLKAKASRAKRRAKLDVKKVKRDIFSNSSIKMSSLQAGKSFFR